MTPEKARENARKVCEVFLRQGRAPEVARRDAEAWALGNYGIEVSLANESQGEDSPRLLGGVGYGKSCTRTLSTRNTCGRWRKRPRGLRSFGERGLLLAQAPQRDHKRQLENLFNTYRGSKTWSW